MARTTAAELPVKARPSCAAAAGLLLATALFSATPAQLSAQARAPVRIMTLESSAFTDGGLIPDAHAQRGRDRSPALRWRGAPDSVRSYVLLVRDLDAVTADGPDGVLHWLVWNIPGDAVDLPMGVPSGAQQSDGSRQISASGPYYRGPAAPAGGPAHHYVFELYALDATINVPAEQLSPAATRDAVLAAMRGRVRGKGVLVGRYVRPAP
jgi:Raf kinase inhibitor-like YbhB/YbcL family protein